MTRCSIDFPSGFIIKYKNIDQFDLSKSKNQTYRKIGTENLGFYGLASLLIYSESAVATAKILNFRREENMNNHFILVLFLGFASLFSGNAFGIILYVPGQYPTIQAGINTASYGDTVQVAAGTYYEHITMKSGVIVQGAGAGDNPSIHSIIDGGGTSTVVTASDVDSAAKIDGFKVTNGFGDVGGGMYNKNSSPTVANCTFSRNSSGWVGGGMNNDNSFPTVTDCTFSENTALLTGGGMNNDTSSPTVTNCIFYKNTATSGSGMNNNNSSPIITKCTFSENSAEGLIG